MSKQSHFLEGLLLGAMFGAVAGVLFAPSSGEETRRKLKETSEQLGIYEDEDAVEGDGQAWQRDNRDRADVMVTKTLQAIEQGFEKVSTLVDNGRKTSKRQASEDH